MLASAIDPVLHDPEALQVVRSVCGAWYNMVGTGVQSINLGVLSLDNAQETLNLAQRLLNLGGAVFNASPLLQQLTDGLTRSASDMTNYAGYGIIGSTWGSDFAEVDSSCQNAGVSWPPAPSPTSGTSAKGHRGATPTSTTTRTPPTTASRPVQSQRLDVLSVSATPPALGSGGGSVVVTAKLEGATTCLLQLVSHQDLPVGYASNARSCSSGTFRAHVTVGSNPSVVSRVLAFALIARNGARRASGKFYVTVRGVSPSHVLSAVASPATLGPSGGTVTVEARVAHANTCQLELLGSAPLRVVYSQNPRSCTSGGFRAHVRIGANPGRTSATVKFELAARNGTSESSGRFYVTVQEPFSTEVVSVGATPGRVKSGGGTVTVKGVVSHALVCRLRLLGSEGIAVAYYSGHKACRTGSFSARVSVGGNDSYVDKALTFGLVATDKTSSAEHTFHIYVEARIFRASIVVPSKRLTAGYQGGWVRVHFHVTALGASDCTVVLSEPGSGQTPTTKSLKCRGGNYVYSVKLPATKIDRTLEVTIRVSGPNETSVSKSVMISQRAQPKSTTTTTRPAPTTTARTTTTLRPRTTTTSKLLSASTTTPAPRGNYVSEVEGDSPLAFWQMKETNGTTMEDSAAGHSHDGSYEGPVGLGETGPVSGARSVQFSGTDALSTYAEYVPQNTLSGSFTVEQWVEVPYGALPCINGDARSFTTRGPTAYYGFFMCLGSDGARFGVSNGRSWLSAGIGANFRPSAGTWYMLDAVVSPTGGTLYIDGRPRATLTWAASTPLLWDRSQYVYIGSGTQRDGAGFLGKVGWTSVYRRVLSASEIAAHWAAG